MSFKKYKTGKHSDEIYMVKEKHSKNRLCRKCNIFENYHMHYSNSLIFFMVIVKEKCLKNQQKKPNSQEKLIKNIKNSKKIIICN